MDLPAKDWLKQLFLIPLEQRIARIALKLVSSGYLRRLEISEQQKALIESLERTKMIHQLIVDFGIPNAKEFHDRKKFLAELEFLPLGKISSSPSLLEDQLFPGEGLE